MWLLSTDRAELRHFLDANAIDRGYAILSHTWGACEQTFQDLQEIILRCKKTGANPREHVSPKIRNCCILAERDGYRWVWIDSCCINKESSTELSEAINSMFRWYEQAEVCYAFLEDVPSDCVLDAPNSEFRRSRWHTRGWTLQELIAPAIVVFVSREWKELGVRWQLAALLAEITTISEDVLMGRALFMEFSIHYRMSWARKRRTTRVEDEAYSLLGLFGVNMPTIYGEGRRAFFRLQLEIMKQTMDTSLFAWGPWISERALMNVTFTDGPHTASLTNHVQYLLAYSPAEFIPGTHYMPPVESPHRPSHSSQERNSTASRPAMSVTETELPRFTLTHLGMETRLPVIEMNDLLVAVLFCQRSGEQVGLLLHRSEYSGPQDPLRPLYHITANILVRGRSRDRVRQVSLGTDRDNLHFQGQPVKPVWRTIYIIPYPDIGNTAEMVCGGVILNRTPVPFRLPHWLVARLSALRFRVSEQHPPWPEDLPVRIYIRNWENQEQIFLDLGRCTDSESAHPHTFWAKIHIVYFGSQHDPDRLTTKHDCHTDHIDSWPDRSRTFGDSSRTVRFSWIPSGVRAIPDKLTVHMELMGDVYDKLLRQANIIIPSYKDLDQTADSPTHPKLPLLIYPSTNSHPSPSQSPSTVHVAGMRSGVTDICRPRCIRALLWNHRVFVFAACILIWLCSEWQSRIAIACPRHPSRDAGLITASICSVAERASSFLVFVLGSFVLLCTSIEPGLSQ